MKLLKFEADWCTHCKQFTKVLTELKLKVTPVDIDKDKDGLSMKYKVRGLPTLLVVDDSGNEIKRVIGYRTKQQLEKEIDAKDFV